MSSSTPSPTTITATPSGSDLLTLLASVPDPRARRGVRHRLPAILAVGLAAVLAGARSFVAIGEWVADQSAETLSQLGVTGLAPGESTIRRAFARLEADALDAVVGAHLWTRTAVIGGRRVIAIDGKTVRGARTMNTTAPHLVAAFDHHAGTVLGQVAVSAKSNEIPAVRTLLTRFDLREVVVTVERDAYPERHRDRDHRSWRALPVHRQKATSPACMPHARSCPGPMCPATESPAPDTADT